MQAFPSPVHYRFTIISPIWEAVWDETPPDMIIYLIGSSKAIFAVLNPSLRKVEREGERYEKRREIFDGGHIPHLRCPNTVVLPKDLPCHLSRV